jgi:hypothetical protein
MSGQQRRRLDLRSWREILGRFERAGTNISEFCAQEGVCESSFYRWRARSGRPNPGLTARLTMRPRPMVVQPSEASFIDPAARAAELTPRLWRHHFADSPLRCDTATA